jgi:hypothetical protein
MVDLSKSSWAGLSTTATRRFEARFTLTFERWVALVLTLVPVLIEAALFQVGIDDLDEGFFAQQAMRLLQGQLPYRDFESLYTPGLLYLHAALFEALGGPSVLAMRFLSLAARAGLVLLLYVIALPLVPRRPLLAALPGAVVLLLFDSAPDRWEPHPGWLSSFFAVLAAWCFAHPPSRWWLLAAGAAAALTYLFKQNTGVYIMGALLIAGVLLRDPRRVLMPVIAFGGVTLVWLLPLVAALDGNVRLLGGFVGAVNQTGLFAPPELTIVVAAACLAAGLWLLLQRRVDPRVRWYLLSGCFVFLTQYPRFDTLHLAWSTPLLLVVASAALDRLRAPFVLGALAALTALAAPGLQWRAQLLGQPTVAISGLGAADGVRVPSETYAELLAITQELQQRTVASEAIFVHPSSPLLYVLADRPNATRFDHLYPGAANADQIAQLIATLEHDNVRVVVISAFWRDVWGAPLTNAELETWLQSNFYEEVRFGAYQLFARRT